MLFFEFCLGFHIFLTIFYIVGFFKANLSERALELLALPDDGVPRLLLDIGLCLCFVFCVFVFVRSALMERLCIFLLL